ncbi:hypothetical protein U1Q18_038635 [Sarracenia purpurea var. burkii]
MGYDSPRDEKVIGNNAQLFQEIGIDSTVRRLLKSSDCCDVRSGGLRQRSGGLWFCTGRQAVTTGGEHEFLAGAGGAALAAASSRWSGAVERR